MNTKIQWFPGHMNKARRQIQEKLPYIDLVLELVDARIPFSSQNPLLEQIIGEKPRLILLTKKDLADPKETKNWQQYFTDHKIANLAIDVLHAQAKISALILPEIKFVLHEKLQREQSKGLKMRPIRVMIIGIPNVGKSTLINQLSGVKKAQIGNTPGVTKGQQWLKMGQNLELLDTPGVLWPKFVNQEVGLKLALTGAIKDSLVAPDDLALFALDFFVQKNPQKLMERFKLTADELELASPQLLLLITKKLGFNNDYERASQRIITDVRAGKLGQFTLDNFQELGKLEKLEKDVGIIPDEE